MSSPFFPYHGIGLHANPFRALTNEEWAEIALIPDNVRQAAASGKCVQILGDQGLGKTSLLLGLHKASRQAGRRSAYEYLPLGARRFETNLAGLDSFHLDEAQRLRRFEIRRLLRAARNHELQLILSSHGNLKRYFQDAGTALITIQLSLSAQSVMAILQHKLTSFSLEKEAPWRLAPSAVDLLIQTYRSCRSMEALLYEYFCTLPAGRVVSGDELRAFLAAAIPPEVEE